MACGEGEGRGGGILADRIHFLEPKRIVMILSSPTPEGGIYKLLLTSPAAPQAKIHTYAIDVSLLHPI